MEFKGKKMRKAIITVSMMSLSLTSCAGIEMDDVASVAKEVISAVSDHPEVDANEPVYGETEEIKDDDVDLSNDDLTTDFPYSKTCSDVAEVRHYALTAEQANSVCARIRAVDAKFRSTFSTNGKLAPAKNDYTSGVLMFVVMNDDDYRRIVPLYWDRRVHDNNDKNTGFYFENDPTNKENFAEALFKATYPNNKFTLRDLEHEYLHYADHHHNWAGRQPSTLPTVWWREGVCDYIGSPFLRKRWVREVKQYNFPLQEILTRTERANDARSTALVYGGGSLAVEFMVTRHRDEVDKMLRLTRAGDWTGYQRWLDGMGNRFGDEFSTWLEEQ
jgi:microbial collagenase